MISDKFRIRHSLLIEHYQFIEFHLEGIYAFISGKDFCSGLTDVNKSNINRIVQEIRRVEREKKVSIFSNADYEKIKHICLRRNYWCHNCYVDMVFDRKTGEPKKELDIKVFCEDLKEAEELRTELLEKMKTIMNEGL